MKLGQSYHHSHKKIKETFTYEDLILKTTQCLKMLISIKSITESVCAIPSHFLNEVLDMLKSFNYFIYIFIYKFLCIYTCMYVYEVIKQNNFQISVLMVQVIFFILFSWRILLQKINIKKQLKIQALFQ